MSLAAQYNASCSRDDCRWIETPDGGVTLTQDRSWTEAYTRQLERRRAADQRQWAHRQRFPIDQEPTPC